MSSDSGFGGAPEARQIIAARRAAGAGETRRLVSEAEAAILRDPHLRLQVVIQLGGTEDRVVFDAVDTVWNGAGAPTMTAKMEASERLGKRLRTLLSGLSVDAGEVAGIVVRLEGTAWWRAATRRRLRRDLLVRLRAQQLRLAEGFDVLASGDRK